MKYFVFTSRSKRMPFTFFVSHNNFSVAQIAKMSLLALTFASLDNYLVLNARCNFEI